MFPCRTSRVYARTRVTERKRLARRSLVAFTPILAFRSRAYRRAERRRRCGHNLHLSRLVGSRFFRARPILLQKSVGSQWWRIGGIDQFLMVSVTVSAPGISWRADHGQRADIVRHEPRARAARLAARLAAGRLGDRYAGPGWARGVGAARRRPRPYAGNRRGAGTGRGGDGPAAGRARGSPLGERRARRPACGAPTPIATSGAFASTCAPTKGGSPRRCA